ncbi:lysophospholipase [Parvibaculum sp.]|uniref:alpha/beta hydrolase n=1 Tax=Parvibaculum sp. TaxID=2024848 RepID=UPI001B21E82A|nr:lysophospholipase [Parvibaculum sp.]MBO6667284.1 lysophospholipase [Parvibaculum sp.]MBO6691413.1 lysophospholipase [Parvibaculum sp.]MBO6713836.1 lysophospholipase [Parvibaculum sp.]
MQRIFPAFLFIVLFSACAPQTMRVGDPVYEPRIERASAARAVMPDGARLPMLIFEAKEPLAVILALHGFNDYSSAFAAPGPGPWFAANGITLVAIDQRGFGRAPGRGLWAGDRRLAADAAVVAGLLREKYPGQPLYLMGESMGAAVAMRMMALDDRPDVDGLILSAPAVWGWQQLNDAYAAALWSVAHIAPSMTLTGRGLDIWPSDNIEMLRALGRDPLVIKETRVDTLYGLVGLMDAAYDAASQIHAPILLLYGAKDEIVPAPAVAGTLEKFGRARASLTAACYPHGYHMLLRDLERETVWKDIAHWIARKEAPLPSGAERELRQCGPLAETG